MKLKATLITICMLSALIAGLAWAADNGPATIKIDIDGKGKAVKAFPHKKHQEMADLKGKCVTCHHKTKADAKPAKCSSCHTHVKDKGKDGAIGFKKAFHKVCQDCHKKKDKKFGKCKYCHK